MNRWEKLALFLGMLSGDGCLSIAHNGEGYRQYPIQFCNNKKEVVRLFDNVFYDLFQMRGKITPRQRLNRQKIWEFKKTSVLTVRHLVSLGFPEGVKRDKLRVLDIIKNGSEKEKIAFILGVIITDGAMKPNRGIMFHMGSKKFLEDLSELLKEIIGAKKEVKEYVQKTIYRSYQLYLNKEERTILLSQMPTWHNGTAPVLS